MLPRPHACHRAIARLNLNERNIMKRTAVEYIGAQRCPTICPLYKAAILAAAGAIPPDIDAAEERIQMLISCDGHDCSWWKSDRCHPNAIQ